MPIADAHESRHLARRSPNPLQLRDIITTFWLRWRLLVAIAAVPVVISLAAALMSKPKFTAEAVMMVMANRESTSSQDLSGFGPSVISVEMLKVVRGEMEILQSPDTLRLALQKAGLGTIYPKLIDPAADASPVVANAVMDKAVEQFAADLRTDSDTNTNLIHLVFTSNARAISLAATRALVDAYMERRNQVLSTEGARILATELARYQAQLAAVETEIQRVRAQYGVLDVTQEQQLATVRSDSISQRIEAVREQLAVNRAQISTAKSLRAEQPDRVLNELAEASAAPNDDGGNMIARLLQERQHLAANYAPDYAPLHDLDARIAAARQNYQASNRAPYATTREARNPQRDELSQRIINLEIEQSALVQQQRELELQHEAAAARAEELRAAEAQLRDLTGRRDGLEAVVRQLTTHEAGARIAEAASGLHNPSVRVLQEPVAPLKGLSSRRLMVIGGVAGGAMLTGLTGLVLAIIRSSFATSDEAERALELPCLGAFGRVRPGDAQANEAAMSDLAAMLVDRASGGTGCGVIHLVSTDPNDERRAFGRALLAELMQRSDGLVQLLALEADVQPSGAKRNALGADAAVLLIDPNVQLETVAAQLSRLRQDARGTLLLGAENALSYGSRRLSALVDGNILVVAAEVTQIAAASTLAAQLRDGGAPLLGFVLVGQRAIAPSWVPTWL